MSQNVRFIEKWINYLNDIDREMCLIAAQKLGSTKDSSVVPELIKALNNRPDDVRTAAARALGEIADPAAVAPLVGLLHDSNPLVASAAADALGAIGHPSAVPALVEILRDYKSGTSHHFQLHGFNRGLFMTAIYALQRIDTREARKAVNTYHR
jgi:HEAT repeat protein